ncbi:MAG: FHA domain-containing protein [Nannocystaceae bacterium]|jgi:pSer/pThr/pTyr-binding forkhead associated (FHA) protein
MSATVTLFDPLVGRRERRSFARLPVVIGRDPSCDLVLAHDFVSGRHAELRSGAADELVFVDLGSTNGTHRGGCRLSPRQPIQIGDGVVVTIGRVELTVTPGAPSTETAALSEADIAAAHRLLRRLGPLYAAWLAAAETAREATSAGLAALSPRARELAAAMIERDLPRCE